METMGVGPQECKDPKDFEDVPGLKFVAVNPAPPAPSP